MGLLKRDTIISFNFTFITFKINVMLKESYIDYEINKRLVIN